MVNCLCFDTATKTGVAYGRSGETPAAISITLAGTWPQRYAQLLKSTRALIEQHNGRLNVDPDGGRLTVELPMVPALKPGT